MEAKEVFDRTKYDKAYKLTLKQIDNNLKNLRWLEQAVLGIYLTLAFNYRLGRSDVVLKGMKDAMMDFISDNVFSGTEPEFASPEAYDWWENLIDASFVENSHPWRPGMTKPDDLKLATSPPKPMFA